MPPPSWIQPHLHRLPPPYPLLHLPTWNGPKAKPCLGHLPAACTGTRFWDHSPAQSRPPGLSMLWRRRGHPVLGTYHQRQENEEPPGTPNRHGAQCISGHLRLQLYWHQQLGKEQNPRFPKEDTCSRIVPLKSQSLKWIKFYQVWQKINFKI